MATDGGLEVVQVGRSSRIAAVLSAIAAGAPGAGVAQHILPGDPVAGHAFVRENCSDCHDVERVQDDMAAFYGPAFVDVASVPGLTATQLRVFLRTPHFLMPDLVLTDPQVDDIVSYILTLRSGAD